jgi:hypothetical protein
MSFDFLNPAMLVGLAALALPVLAHLLSRKKYDIVDWGAMQFLELGRDARRKIRLEQLLLMLLRMGLVALLALALARPWIAGGFLTRLTSKQPRDVAIVLDGSYSMGWEGRTVTPHAAAHQWVHRFLEELQPGDTVSLIDARDRVRVLTPSPTRNFGEIREQLNALPPPSGSSNLTEAVTRALQLLSRTSHLARDVIVLTDGQARCWSVDDPNLWVRFDDLQAQPAVRPRVWVVDVNQPRSGDRTNFSVDALQLSRELTVVDFPVQVRTKVRYTGGTEPVTRRVSLEIDGQRLAERTLNVQLQPEGEASVEFEYRFQSHGSHLIGVVLDDDNLPADNRAYAAVTVAEALPVLLVDGRPHLDSTQSETFFARAALTAASNRTPWIRARTVPWDRFTPADLREVEVVVLANVPRLTDVQAGALKDYVTRGGGLFIALGDLINADNYNDLLFDEGNGPLPASLDTMSPRPARDGPTARVLSSSLELPWIARFRAENEGGFTEARFSRWWRVTPARRSGENGAAPGNNPAGDDQEGAGVPETTTELEANPAATSFGPSETSAIVAARLTTNDPLVLTRRFGRGGVVLLTSSLAADWSTLPARPDYVALLHEIVFHLAAGKAVCNVEAGEPLLWPVPVDADIDQYTFEGPDNTELEPRLTGNELTHLLRLDDTHRPGVYALHRHRPDGDTGAASRPEYFVVNFDRSESDLAPLSDEDRAFLQENDRMAFADTLDELKTGLFADDSRSEIWHLLLLAFLGMLIGEVLMTRRLVRGGHEVSDE